MCLEGVLRVSGRSLEGISTGQIKLGQVKSGQIKSGQVKSEQVKLLSLSLIFMKFIFDGHLLSHDFKSIFSSRSKLPLWKYFILGKPVKFRANIILYLWSPKKNLTKISPNFCLMSPATNLLKGCYFI